MTRPDRRATIRRSVARRRLVDRRIGPIPAWLVAAFGVAALAVVGIATANTLSGEGSAQSVPYDVGEPGVGQAAPDFTLRSTTGEPFSLSAERGKTVLLYFHEGLMCAPCWKQLDDVQTDLERFRALGINEIAAISVDPADAQRTRAESRGISIVVLSDPDLSVSARYDALSYGMMQGTRPGHTFILVGPDGTIRWRADYGGPPNFTMYVPDDALLAELRRALGRSG